jgi:lipopolysaccharide export system protein LptC
MAMRGTGRDEGAERDRAQRRIGRRVRTYSRIVSWMKVLLPLAAVAVIVAIFFGGRDKGELTDIFTAEELATLSAGLRLDNPRFAGVTERGEPFTIHAEWALPDQALPRSIDLERPEGEIAMRNGRTIVAHAASGRLHRVDQTLLLHGGVVIDSSDGYHLKTERITFDLDAETADAPGPVSGSGPRGTIEAGSFRAATGGGEGAEGDQGGKIWFENRVRLVFIPAMKPAGE